MFVLLSLVAVVNFPRVVVLRLMFMAVPPPQPFVTMAPAPPIALLVSLVVRSPYVSVLVQPPVAPHH